MSPPMPRIARVPLTSKQPESCPYCGGHHPELIEYRYLLVDGVEVPHGQSGPRCFRAGCPDDVAANAKEQRVGRSTPDAERG